MEEVANKRIRDRLRIEDVKYWVTELDDYSSVILQASKIAEQIIQVIGIENGYSFEDGYYTDSDGNRQKYNSPLSFIKAEKSF